MRCQYEMLKPQLTLQLLKFQRIHECQITLLHDLSWEMYHTSLQSPLACKRRTHSLTWHPRSNTAVVGLVLQSSVAIGVIFKPFGKSTGLRERSYLKGCLGCNELQRKLYMWAIKNNADTSWCCTCCGRLHTADSKLLWRSRSSSEDLDKVPMIWWKIQGQTNSHWLEM